MRKILLAVALVSASTLAFAAEPGSIQGTSGGVNIMGNTNISANAQDTSAVATGESVAKNAIGAIKGGTNIMGNTNISANAKNTSAIASGKSKAVNSIGVIGGD
jgi:uncharacterized cupredoxin-like copper-binding protein